MRIVARDVGRLLMLIGMTMVVPLLVSLLYGEYHTLLAFAIASAITSGSGWLAWRGMRGKAEGEGKEYHPALIASAGWLLTATFGMLPFWLTALLTPDDVAQSFVPAGDTYRSSLVHLASPLHAFFESMSAFTTTGLTMAVHEPSIGHGLLFYRSFGQWLGGAGVIVLSLAILRQPSGINQIALYESESAGTKLRPSISGTARTIWKVYFVLTLGSAAYLATGTLLILPSYGLGPTLFDAINHAMTGQSTGGFSTLDDSIAGYGSHAMELLHILPMMMGATSIPVYYHLARYRRTGILWRDIQTRLFLLVLVIGVPILVTLLLGSPGVSSPVREGLFQVISAASTTGWQTSEIAEWRPTAILVLVAPFMVIGGSAGATVGGIKLARAYLIARGIGWRVRRTFLPAGATVNVTFGERALSSREFLNEVAEAAGFAVLYAAILFVSVAVISLALGPDVPLANIILESASAQGTVGLTANLTGPDMPPTVEIVFIVQMWLGRLEIFPVLTMVRALVFGVRTR